MYSEILQKYEFELLARGFSRKTIKSYLYHFSKFLNFTKKSVCSIRVDDIKYFLVFLKKKEYSNATINLTLESIKFYFIQILKRKFIIKSLKKKKHIPLVINKNIIFQIIESLTNIKHKLVIAVLYSSGLRVSEVVKLKKTDFNLNDKLIYIKNGKGNKDRIVILSNKVILLCKQYFLTLNSDWVFPNNRGSHISVRTVQKVLKLSAKKIGFNNRIYCHALRSSFATHLAGDNVDLITIKKLLGHNSIKTTIGYIGYNNSFKNINDPLDKL